MKSLKLALLLALTLALATAIAHQAVRAAESADADIGQKLVRDLWAKLKAGDATAVKQMMSPAFQSAHQDGARSRDEELALIANLHLGPYTLSNFKTTQDGPTLVVTYLVSVEETIDGKRLSRKPEPRLTVFIKSDTSWKWLAHANLKPLKKERPR